MNTARAASSTLTAVLILAGLDASVVRAAWPPEVGNGGLQVSNVVGHDIAPTIVSDGTGGTFVAWLDPAFSVRVQHLSGRGDALWGSNGVLVPSEADAQFPPCVVLDGAGGVIVLWIDGQIGGQVIRGQRLDAQGQPLWTSGGVALTGSILDRTSLKAVTDGAGGAVMSWAQASISHGNISPYSIRAQRADPSGARLWGTNGVSVAAAGESLDPCLVSDGAAGAIVAWTDQRFGEDHVYAQRVSSTGTMLWIANGVTVAGLPGGQLHPAITSDGAGGALVVWADYRNAATTASDIYAQRVSPAGGLLWSGFVAMCAATGSQENPVVVSDGAGGVIAAWNDNRASGDIYAQKVLAGPNFGWLPNGVAVCSAVGVQQSPAIATDAAGGAYVTWLDARTDLNGDIWVQRIESPGTPRWAAGGIPVCTAGATQAGVAIAADGSGNAVLAWQDSRTGVWADIYAQRVEIYGNLGDPAPRITSVRDVPNDQGMAVKVSWTASYLDVDPTYGIGDYVIERQIAPQSWVSVGTVPFGPLAEYSAVVPSSGDSIGTIPYSVYRVGARPYWSTAVSWTSAPDSGYSVDNLSPYPPAGAQIAVGENGTMLSWSPNQEPDLAGYRVYRSSSPDRIPSPASLVGEPTTSQFLDPSRGAGAYGIAAVDRNGNESVVVVLTSPATTQLPVAARLSLSRPSPNPARYRTSLVFTLPKSEWVRVSVLDVQGRQVATLANGLFAAGEHRLTWDMKTDAGGGIPAGIYSIEDDSGSRGVDPFPGGLALAPADPQFRGSEPS